MRRLAVLVGRVVFELSRPILRIYLNNSERTRIVLRHDDTVLVLKGWLGDGKWHLPGGGMHKGEEPLSGARRELLEETGIALPSDEFAYQGSNHSVEKNGARYTYHLFVVTVSEQLPVKKQWHEISDADWLPISVVGSEKVSSVTTCAILRSLE